MTCKQIADKEDLTGKILLFRDSVLHYEIKPGVLGLVLSHKKEIKEIIVAINNKHCTFSVLGLKSCADVLVPDNSLQGKSFAITGELPYPRDFYRSIIEYLGGHYCSSISKKTMFLITDQNCLTSKKKLAMSYGTTIISSREFEKIYNKEI